MAGTIIEIRRYCSDMQQHRHDYHQIILPLGGTLEIEIQHRSGRIGAGNIAGNVGSFVPAGSDHAFLASRPGAFIVLDVPQGIGPDPVQNAEIAPFFAISAETRGLIDYLAAMAPARHEAQGTLAPPLQLAWTTLMLDRIAAQTAPPARAELALHRALAFMRAHLADPIRTRDIARAAGLSESRLHASFARHHATTPHAHLIALRLEAAERLLADPRLSIAQIAQRTGHGDQSALTRIMQRERGTTPARLRRALTQSG